MMDAPSFFDEALTLYDRLQSGPLALFCFAKSDLGALVSGVSVHAASGGRDALPG